MKIFLAIILALLMAAPAQAEKIRPAGWTAVGNTQAMGSPRISPIQRSERNDVITLEEEKAIRLKAAKAMASGDTKVSKKLNGTTNFEKKILSEGKRKTDSFWSNLNN